MTWIRAIGCTPEGLFVFLAHSIKRLNSFSFQPPHKLVTKGCPALILHLEVQKCDLLHSLFVYTTACPQLVSNIKFFIRQASSLVTFIFIILVLFIFSIYIFSRQTSISNKVPYSLWGSPLPFTTLAAMATHPKMLKLDMDKVKKFQAPSEIGQNHPSNNEVHEHHR